MEDYGVIQNVKSGNKIIVYGTPYFKAKQIAEHYGLVGYEHLLLIDDVKQLKGIKIDNYLQLFVQKKYPKIIIVK